MMAFSSLALISARATISAIDILTMLSASYLYLLCQALDIRTLQAEFHPLSSTIISEELTRAFPELDVEDVGKLAKGVVRAFEKSLEGLMGMDAVGQMECAMSGTSSVLIDFFASLPPSPLPPTTDFTTTSSAASSASANSSSLSLPSSPASPSTPSTPNWLSSIKQFQSRTSSRLSSTLQTLRLSYLSGEKGEAPADDMLGHTKGIYSFVRRELGVKMHGIRNYERFEGAHSSTTGALDGLTGDASDSDGLAGGEGEGEFGESSIGGDVSLIYEVCNLFFLSFWGEVG